MLASIKHPHIISFRESFLEGDLLCIVMEFAENGDLEKQIAQLRKRKNAMPEWRILEIFVQIVAGLRELHKRKIMHRDLKAANVFVCAKRVKIGDLNVAKEMINTLLFTQTGTPYYASPEVWKDEPYDFKSDVWSLGIILYQLAMLRLPFRSKNMSVLSQ